ncbi:MAG: cytochrome c [Acidimicrobiia bacterium]|nr:cytochrome c [Acidimicrobiia bacterium]
MGRTKLAVAAAVAAAGVWTWSCTQAAPPDPESEGAKLFVANCAACHGQDAGGLKAPNLRTGLDTDYVAATVTDGKGEGMPGFAGTLSPEQIHTLAEYIHSIGSAGD